MPSNKTLWIRVDGEWVELATRNYVDTRVAASAAPGAYASLYAAPFLAHPATGDFVTLIANADAGSWLSTDGSGHSILTPGPGIYSVIVTITVDGWKWASGDTLTLDGGTKPIELIVTAAGFGQLPFIINQDISSLTQFTATFDETTVVESPGDYFFDQLGPFSCKATKLDGTGGWVDTLSVSAYSLYVFRVSSGNPVH